MMNYIIFLAVKPTPPYGYLRYCAPLLPVVSLFSPLFSLSLLPFLVLSSHNPSIFDVVFLVFCHILVSLTQIFSVTTRVLVWPCAQPIWGGTTGGREGGMAGWKRLIIASHNTPVLPTSVLSTSCITDILIWQGIARINIFNVSITYPCDIISVIPF